MKTPRRFFRRFGLTSFRRYDSIILTLKDALCFRAGQKISGESKRLSRVEAERKRDDKVGFPSAFSLTGQVGCRSHRRCYMHSPRPESRDTIGQGVGKRHESSLLYVSFTFEPAYGVQYLVVSVKSLGQAKWSIS